ncbi:MAG: hypothetical protein JO143_08090, partial [Acetobacteraceae bacterium]|nr:hypothetical protein [Acetobacteraceae bacterium]
MPKHISEPETTPTAAPVPDVVRRRFGRWSMTLASGIGLLATARLPHQQREASRWVDHTLEVLARAATLEADLATVTSEGRGFLVDQTTDSARRFD